MDIEITIRRPDDWHVHFREGLMLRDVLPATADVFERALIICNTKIPVYSAWHLIRHRSRVRSIAPSDFNPLFAVMLTRYATPAAIETACDYGLTAVKYIPENTSTNSEYGIPLPELYRYYDTLQVLADRGIPLMIHPELARDPRTGKTIPYLFREREAMIYIMRLFDRFSNLKVVLEHVTTSEMVDLVNAYGANVAATITPHYMRLTYDDVFDRDHRIINPFNFCLPVPKFRCDRFSLIEAAISGSKKFFFATDSAPHYIWDKVIKPPAAGLFTAPVALQLAVQIFDEHKALNKVEDFTSRIGAEVYNLPLNQGKITLEKKSWVVPRNYNNIRVFMGGETLDWKIKERFV